MWMGVSPAQATGGYKEGGQGGIGITRLPGLAALSRSREEELVMDGWTGVVASLSGVP
jgi:hypothetical protein